MESFHDNYRPDETNYEFDSMSDEQRDATGRADQHLYTRPNVLDQYPKKPLDHYDTDMSDEQWSNS